MDIIKFGQPDQNIEMNNFSMPHRKITTIQFGKLYPMMLKEALPGDVLNLRISKLARFLPLLAPVMTNCIIVEDVYFVPNRILWDDWSKFIVGAGSEEFPEIAYEAADINTDITPRQSIAAYMGIPITSFSLLDEVYLNALPFAAYNAIYNQYYRNDYLQPEKTMKATAGFSNSDLQLTAQSQPYQRNWKKDYFLGATPTPQHGMSVLLPLTTTDDLAIGWRAKTFGEPSARFRVYNTGADAAAGNSIVTGSGTITNTGTPQVLTYDPKGSLFVNVNADAVTIDTLKTAMALQTVLERDLTGGLKYIQNIKAHFDVIIPDYTAQVPEWLGSCSQNLDITEVLSKSEVTTDDSTIPLGSYAGHGFSAGSSDTINYRCTEHGWFMSILSVIPELVYPNTGLHKHWRKKTRFDYANPGFAMLGMQPVYKNELYLENNDEPVIWGYRPIYDDYKFEASIASGDITDTLDYWANYIKLTDSIALNDINIQIDQRIYDLDRIFSIDTTGPSAQISDYIYIDVHYDLNMMRKLPRFNIPNLGS